MQTTHTRIAGSDVPVQPGPPTRVYFCSHCEPRDAPGFYDFWTMKNEERKLRLGRRPAGRDPGERFQMMEGQAGYEDAWEEAQTAILVRPSSTEELEGWLNDSAHVRDAPCAQFGEVDGHPIKILKEPSGRYFVQAATSPAVHYRPL